MKDSTPSPEPLRRTAEYSPVEPGIDAGVGDSGARPTVLVIDDDWAICDAVKDVLDDAGFHTICLDNGARALEHLERSPLPAAILLDLFMPVMDGWTFADRVRAAPGLREIPIIVMTASGPHWGYPAPRVLRKPIFGNQLVAAVRKAIGSGSGGGGASASL
jgi:CheY-like chemotaxis protein